VGYRERRSEMLATQAAPHLEPGEQVQTGFMTLTGWGIFTMPAETFVVTDRAILVMGRGGVQRLPRDLRFGRPTGLYYRFHLDRTYRVAPAVVPGGHRRRRGAARDADPRRPGGRRALNQETRDATAGVMDKPFDEPPVAGWWRLCG
jgi:hypothetical protein